MLIAMTGFGKEGGLFTSNTFTVTFAEAASELPAAVLVACTARVKELTDR